MGPELPLEEPDIASWPPTSLVGRIPAEASVSMGAATYAISIVKAPGRRGVEPDVKLVYSSGSGGDVAGVGWAVTGAGSILRCGHQPDPDGSAVPVTVGPDDKLCLNGQRLVLVDGHYGADGAEYRPEFSFSTRVRQTGDIQGAGACFSVEDKSGTISEFGACGDPAAVDRPIGGPAAWAWRLSIVRDRLGNQIDYTYDSLGGQHRLTEITYTGFQGARGDRRIAYEYEVRPDQEVRFVNGGRLHGRYRLAAITSWVAATVVRRYELEYVQSPTTGRSLLHRLSTCAATDCEAGVNTLAPTTFEYSGRALRDTQAPAFARVQIDSPEPDLERVSLGGDYDGDGRKDWWLRRYQEPWGGQPIPSESLLMLSNGGVPRAVSASQFEPELDGAPYWSQISTDLDHDGRSDLVGTRNGNLAIASWNAVTEQLEYTESNLSLPSGTRVVRYADFDVDGRIDALLSTPNGWFIAYRSSASGLEFGAIVPWPGLAADERVSLVDDIDGNGYPDVLIEYHGVTPYESLSPRPQSRILFTLPTGLPSGPSFIDFELHELGGPLDSLSHMEGRGLADINGDGLIDIVANNHARPCEPGECSSGQTIVTEDVVYLNRGRHQSATPQPLFSRVVLGGDGLSAPAHLRRAVLYADIDSDGRDEMLVPTVVVEDWCYLHWVGETETYEYCTNFPNPFDFESAPGSVGGLDRAVYRWDAYDFQETFDAQAAEGVRITTARRETDLEAPVFAAQPADWFGDGALDVGFELQFLYGDVHTGIAPLGHYDGNTAYGSFVAKNLNGAPDLLLRAVDGFGSVRGWSYAPLSSAGDDRCVSAAVVDGPQGQPIPMPFYFTRHDLHTPNHASSPFTSSGHVVARMEEDNGLGASAAPQLGATCYFYRDAWMNRLGRGFMGFGMVVEEERSGGEPGNDLRTVTEYHLDFPRNGRAFRTTSELSSGPLVLQSLEMTRSYWDVHQPEPGIYSVFVDAETKWTFDPATGAEVARVDTDFGYATSTDLDFGRITRHAVTYQDAFHTQSEAEIFTYDPPDEVAWWLDKLTSKLEVFQPVAWGPEPSMTTFPVNVVGSKQTRTTYAYYGNRLPFTESLQTGVPEQAYQQSILGFDAYGNPTLMDESADGASTRRTELTPDPDGYFILQEKRWTSWNGQSVPHAVDRGFDPRFGAMLFEATATSRTDYTFDDFGRRITETVAGLPATHHRLAPCDATCGPQTAYLSISHAAGSPRVVEHHDRLDRVVRRVGTFPEGDVHVLSVFDEKGREFARSAPTMSPSAATYTTFAEFDALGRPGIKVVEGGARGDLVTRFTYSGLESWIELANGATKSRVQDGRGRMVRATDADGNHTHYRYDARSNLVLIEDPAGNQTVIRYDDRGRRTSIDHPDRGVWNYVHDGFDHMVEQRDARGDRVYFQFDQMSRLRERRIKRVGWGQPILEAEWSYDADRPGLLDWERGDTAGNGRFCRGFAYDALGRPSQVSTFIDGEVYFEQNLYDSAGRLALTRNPSGEVVRYGYDPTSGEPTGVSDLAGQLYYEVRGRNANRQLTADRFGNGIEGSYLFHEPTGQSERIVLWDPSEAGVFYQDLSYSYDTPLWDVHSQTNVLTGATETFSYDALQRVRSSERTWPGAGSTLVSYTYDALGNLTQKSDYASSFNVGAAGRNNSAQAGPHGLISYEDASGSVVADFDYDANGNLLAGDGRTAVFGVFDLALEVEAAGSVTTIAYGPDLERFERFDSAPGSLEIVTHYVGKDLELVRRPSTGEYISRAYVSGKVMIETREWDGVSDRAVHFLHPDRLDSTDVVSTADPTSGQVVVVERRGFGPFGAPRDGDWQTQGRLYSGGGPGSTTLRGFTGHEHFDAQRIVHMNGRVYDYQLGRFLSVDPVHESLADLQSHNSYSYVWNNAPNFTDPSGFSSDQNKDEPPVVRVRRIGVTGSRTTHVATVEFHGNDLVIVKDAAGREIGRGQRGPEDTGFSTKGFSGEAKMWVRRKNDEIALKNRIEATRASLGENPGQARYEQIEREWATLIKVVETPLNILMFATGVGELRAALQGARMASAARRVGQSFVPPGAGGAHPVRIGQVGESAVRAVHNIGPKVKIHINGRGRIPDGLTNAVLSEVKNVKSLSFSRQLRDFADFARQTGRRFDLYVRQSTSLSTPLQDAVNQGTINLRFIP